MITPHKSLKFSWPQAATLLAWLLPLLAWAPLAYPGYFEFHSGFLPIFNLNDLMRHPVDLGWAPVVGQPYDLLRGDGALPYRLAALLHVLGAAPVAAVKLVFGASLLAGSLGMYGWARRRLGPWPALLAATVYVYLPVVLATIYVRGAFAQAVFLGLMPWVLWAADAALSGSRAGAVGLALGLAAAFWTQAGLALWLAAIVLAYLLVLPRDRMGAGASGTREQVGEPRPPLLKQAATAGESRFKPAGTALAGWAGGLVFGLLGLLPVVLQHGWGGSTYVSFSDHPVYPFQLLAAGWGTGPSIPGPDDTLTFSLGAVAFGLAALGLVLSRLAAQRQAGAEDGSHTPTPPHPHTSFHLVAVLLLVALSTTLAAPLWRLLPFLARTLTYPWQLLLLAAPWLAWLAGLGGYALLERWPAEHRNRGAIPLFAALLTVVLLGAYGDLHPTAVTAPVPDAPVAVFGDNEVALLSAVTAGPPGPGGHITLLARWQALRPLSQDYTVFFHALGSDGQRWGQQDTMPQDGKLPTSQWRPGQVVQDRYQVILAPDAPIGGDYRYLLGLYRWQTGERLTIGTDDKVVLTP